MKKQFKRIAYDIAGVTLIIISPIVGSVPGPGGFALFFAGLGLLAVHNQWAQDLLHWAKKNGENMLEIIFPPIPKVQLIHDFIGITLLVVGISILIFANPPYAYVFAPMFLASAAFWLLYNRHRYRFFIPKKHK